MKTNRRQFLKLFSLATVDLTVDPLQSVITHREIYINRSLGIAFKTPPKWHFYSAHRMKAMHDEQITQPSQLLVNELLDELKNQPLVTLGKDPEHQPYRRPKFSPSIVIRLEPLEDKTSLFELYTASNLFLDEVCKDYQNLGMRFGEISGYQALFGQYSYLFEAQGMQSTPITGSSCMIETQSHYYSINMYNYTPEDPSIRSHFRDFLTDFIIL